ncbi:hypothetical protein G6F65_018180 [Rhizopus arrhizus]|nr:hypothetical protein G6F65_018180 [Rhizopus arrhizus]
MIEERRAEIGFTRFDILEQAKSVVGRHIGADAGILDGKGQADARDRFDIGAPVARQCGHSGQPLAVVIVQHARDELVPPPQVVVNQPRRHAEVLGQLHHRDLVQ